MNDSASKNNPSEKPELMFGQILNMSFGFLGLQFCFALQTGNASRILQTFGADVEHLTWYWLAAPLTGMIIQPIIGHYSDNTWTRLGRRRPYFLCGAILAGLALFFMPNASILASIIPPVFIGACILMILDASFNVGMEPFRALVADNLPEQQHNLGFSVQTSLIGVGAILGSILPYALANWIGVAKTAEPGLVPHNVEYSFYAGTIVLLITVLWSVIKTKEFPPDVYRSFQKGESVKGGKERSVIGEVFYNFIHMPGKMKQLSIVQFFSWYAFFSMWVFMTPAIATHVFHIRFGDTSSMGFNNAANWVNILFCVYNATAAMYALLLPVILKVIPRKIMHSCALTTGGLGLISLMFIQNQYLLILPMLGIGLAWGSVLAIPYAILSDCLPPNKVGVYMGIFNFTITLPQILNGIFGGLIVKYVFDDHAIYALVLAGVFLIAASISTFFIKNDERK